MSEPAGRGPNLTSSEVSRVTADPRVTTLSYIVAELDKLAARALAAGAPAATSKRAGARKGGRR